MFPVCCYTCRKVISPHYEVFRKKVWEIQVEGEGEGDAGEAKAGAEAAAGARSDRIAGVLSELGIHRLCCRIIFLSFVDNHLDEIATKGEQFGDRVYARTAGEISGTVKIIRTPVDAQGNPTARSKPTALLAR